jgi:hypothetical protein
MLAIGTAKELQAPVSQSFVFNADSTHVYWRRALPVRRKQRAAWVLDAAVRMARLRHLNRTGTGGRSNVHDEEHH